jgi:hypothetical protein
MSGERLAAAEVTAHGVLGDRAYALIDVETGKVASAKSVRLFPGLLACRAAFVDPPRPGAEPPPVRIEFSGGGGVTSGSNRADQLLSAHFGRAVRLARAAPDDFTIDQYHPDIADVDPAGHRETIVEQKLGAAFFRAAGIPSPAPAGSFFDLFPMSVVTTSTLKRLGELQPGSRFDPRRFRMNIVIETPAAGFVENAWVGRGLGVGDDARLAIAMPDPRCVMTTLGQAELPPDLDVLRTLVEHNRMSVGGSGRFPCAGVYGVITAPGAVRVGDPVTLI